MGNQKGVIVIDYGVGNIASLVNMFDSVGVIASPSGNPQEIAQAERIVLPGVGAFGHAMGILKSTGLDQAIRHAAQNGAHLLGICLGMQLLADYSEEGDVEGLGLIGGHVRRIRPSNDAVKVPNMGWREIVPLRQSWLFPPSEGPARFYFAHSYHYVCDDENDVVAITDYDGPKTVAVERERVAGAQFHPEKSHRFGQALLKSFSVKMS